MRKQEIYRRREPVLERRIAAKLVRCPGNRIATAREEKTFAEMSELKGKKA
jgi:hypothetical protein